MSQYIVNHFLQILAVGAILGFIAAMSCTYLREGKITLHDLIIGIFIGIVGSYFVLLLGTITLCEQGAKYLKKHDIVLLERHPVSVGREIHAKFDRAEIRIR